METLTILSRQSSSANSHGQDSCIIVRAYPHRLSQDPKVPVTPDNTRVHYLDQDWYLVPISKENRHSLAEDVFTLTNEPKIDSSHKLQQDPKMYSGNTPMHGIDDDPVGPAQLAPVHHGSHREKLAPIYESPSPKPHDIRQDEATPYSNAVSTPHDIHEDKVSVFEKPSFAAHGIHRDAMGPSDRSAYLNQHRLEEDDKSATNSRDHALGHTLDTDTKITMPSPQTSLDTNNR